EYVRTWRVQQEVVVGGFQTGAGGVLTAEWGTHVLEILAAVLDTEGRLHIASPPAEQRSRGAQVGTGDVALCLAPEHRTERIHRRLRIGIGGVWHHRAILNLEGIAEGVERGGVGSPD